MKTLGVYNDNTVYKIKDYKIIKFIGDSSLITKDAHDVSMAEYTYTYKEDAIFINSIIKNFNYKDLLIVDGTTSIGGNFIYFVKEFDYNIGIEINKNRFYILDNIISNLNIENKKIILINNSFVKLYNKIIDLNKQNNIIFFLDPPWGGPEYKKFDKLLFGLDGIPLNTIVKDILKNNNTTIIIKLPHNFYLDIFENKYNIYTLKYFNIVVFNKN
jgi:hypothetical protein